MHRSRLIHASWALVTISTFVLGSQWARQSRETGQQKTRWTSGDRDILGMSELAGQSASITSGDPAWIDDDRDAGPGSAAPLMTEEIDLLVRSATRSPNPLERRRAFDRILQELQSSNLTAEQVMALRKSMAENRANGTQWRLFDYAWGANRPGAAVAYLDDIPAKYHDLFLGNMIPGLASENAQAAIDLFQSLEPDLQSKIRPRFLEGLVDNDIALATDYLYDSSDPDHRDWRPMDTLAREIEKDRGLESALSWAADLPEGSLRSNAWSAAYAVWGSQDPYAAAQAITEMPPSADRDQAINGFTAAHAHQDGERATIWAAQITSPSLREGAMIRAGTQYFRQDRSAASAWFESSGLPEATLGRMGQTTQVGN